MLGPTNKTLWGRKRPQGILTILSTLSYTTRKRRECREFSNASTQLSSNRRRRRFHGHHNMKCLMSQTLGIWTSDSTCWGTPDTPLPPRPRYISTRSPTRTSPPIFTVGRSHMTTSVIEYFFLRTQSNSGYIPMGENIRKMRANGTENPNIALHYQIQPISGELKDLHRPSMHRPCSQWSTHPSRYKNATETGNKPQSNATCRWLDTHVYTAKNITSQVINIFEHPEKKYKYYYYDDVLQ